MTLVFHTGPAAEVAALLANAETALRETTISYPDWQRRIAAGKYADVTVTKWWQAFDKLEQARAAVNP